jgi:ankyrin repeat protein
MHLDTIPLEPNSSYVAEGQMSMMGTTITSRNIMITTDEVGRVKTFNDGTPGTQVSMADIWEYTKIRNTQTGQNWDLRLHTAALRGLADMARLALSEGADVRLRVKQASTALHWAAAKGREEIVKLLVDHGADVNAADDLGWTPAFLALKGGFNAIVALLVAKGAKTQAVINGKPLSFSVGADSNDQLIEAVEAGNLEAARAAINGGADINCLSDDGWTPLLSAVKYDPQITELLLAHGADPNIASDRGYTPLMRAAGLGKLHIVKLLLAAGADRQMRDCDGKTAGQLAMESGQIQCAVMLQ